jgi:diadenylate cyclase
MAKNRTGALIVLKRKSPLDVYEQSGDVLDAMISSRLIESVFNKYSPLHDGAMIISNNKIHAARCVLPVSDNFELPANYGLRHRAAIGLTEETDALVIIISEETGEISLAEAGRIKRVDTKVLFRILEKEFIDRKAA